MLGVPVWLLLAGCPWIPPALHRENQARLDQDTDTATDGATDTGHTGAACAEEAEEPNDSVADAAPVSLGSTVTGAVCDGGPDHFSVPIDRFQILAVSLACDGDAILRVAADGIPWETRTDACGRTVRLGMGPGTYTAGVFSPSGAPLGYTLELRGEECFVDEDSDGQPSAADCDGGNDCDDARGSGGATQRGATDVPGNQIDEDCDGADDLLRQEPCNARVNSDSVPDLPPLPCGAPDADPVWHHFTFRTPPGGLVNLFLTPIDEDADLYALYTDDDGRYGLDPGEDELDGEDLCGGSVGGDCPSTCLTTAGGTAHLWVAQRDCAGPVAYQLRVGGDVAEGDLTLEADVAGPPGAR